MRDVQQDFNLAEKNSPGIRFRKKNLLVAVDTSVTRNSPSSIT